MKEFKGKVAVITGAANGIGFGLAERCAKMGMKVVLAGINEANLAKAEEKLKPTGVTLLSVRTDVSKREDIETLARRALDAFGAIHLLVNNAGVIAGTSVWESTWEDWEWVINVNLWGVIYGIKVFTPLMLEQDVEAHIVNVASIAGLLPRHPSAAYQVTKHAVVALSENLYDKLAQQNAKVKVSLLCPGFVKTSIMDSGRNRPGNITNNQEDDAGYRWMQEAVEDGMSIQDFTEHVFRAIRDEQFYVLTHPEYEPDIQKRMANILQQKNPV